MGDLMAGAAKLSLKEVMKLEQIGQNTFKSVNRPCMLPPLHPRVFLMSNFYQVNLN